MKKGIKSYARHRKKSGLVAPGFMLGMEIRRKFGTTVDFCAKTGMDYYNVFHFLKGQRRMSQENLGAMCDALGVESSFYINTQRQFWGK